MDKRKGKKVRGKREMKEGKDDRGSGKGTE